MMVCLCRLLLMSKFTRFLAGPNWPKICERGTKFNFKDWGVNVQLLAIYQTLPFCSFFSKSSFWYGFYLKNENEKFLFYLKYKENMCGSWFASQFTPPIPPPTNQPNAEIWHINVSVPKTKRWIIQIKKLSLLLPKEQNKTKQNIIPFFLNVRK